MNLIYINLLPDEIINIIWNNYVNPITKVWVNKKYYKKYHYLILKKIKKYDNFIRDIIRLDYTFVAQHIIDDNIISWSKPKIIKYQNIIFQNYLNYINHIINKYNSGKTKNLLKDKLKYLKCEKIWQSNSINIENRWNGI
jgi:hypothetical protein